MNTDSQITQDMATSMKAGDAQRTGVLRLLRAAFKNEQIKLGHELAQDEVLKVLQREAKQRRDSIQAYQEAHRPELAAVENEELVIIAQYLPRPLSADELVAIVDTVISETSASGPGAMGGVIKEVVARAGARADGGTVAKVVRERLL